SASSRPPNEPTSPDRQRRVAGRWLHGLGGNPGFLGPLPPQKCQHDAYEAADQNAAAGVDVQERMLAFVNGLPIDEEADDTPARLSGQPLRHHSGREAGPRRCALPTAIPPVRHTASKARPHADGYRRAFHRPASERRHGRPGPLADVETVSAGLPPETAGTS